MFPALFNGSCSSPRAGSLSWLRGIMVLSVVFSVSACAYDGVYYGAHGGSHSSYYGGQQGAYQHGYHGGYRHGYQHGYQAPRYNHYGHSRLNQAQRRHEAEIYRRHFESQKRFEQRRHEARKHPNAQRGRPHIHKHRSPNAGSRHHQQRQHSERPQHRRR
ncbi:hypothetical protein [Pusillimonas sp.]|uniref:hypothetical protein n=1 Tax=Pusillimonas sp. TaxID=3040095 RepID=UPI0037C7D8CF